MHAAKSAIDRKDDREPQSIENFVDDPGQGGDYKSVIHSAPPSAM